MLLFPGAGHEGVRGVESVRGRGPGLQGPESQAEDKSPAGVEGSKPATNDVVNLERRLGLLSGVALIVGTMIGQYTLLPASSTTPP